MFRRLPFDKQCPVCNTSFLFCCVKCYRKSYYKKHKRNYKVLKHNSYNKLCTSVSGSISELIIATDLMGKGYEVYRALSPACSGDLIAERDGHIYKLEVRTGYIDKKNHLISSKSRIKARYLAVYIPKQSEIRYYLNSTSERRALWTITKL